MKDIIRSTPNILWVMLDHVTFRHYKMTRGVHPVLDTYERLAREGMEFTNCHSVHPLCLPARAGMLTGVYAHKHGKLDNEHYPDAGLPFYTDYLRERGYRVAHFGKNHSGYKNFPEHAIDGFYPQSYGNPYRSPEYKDYLKRNGYGNPVYHQEWAMPTGGVLHDNGDYDLTESENFNMYSAGYIKGRERVHESDFLTSSALDWIEAVAREGSPFSVRVDMWGPHHAYQVPEEAAGLLDAKGIEEYPSFAEPPLHKAEMARNFYSRISERNTLRGWGDWQPVMARAYEHYTYIDRAVGRMLDALEEKNLLENTIVIYTADHGDALGSHGGFVDKAGDLMEELMSIPLVIRFPGLKGGAKCDAHVSNLDIVPTVLEMAGITPPPHMDGQSLVPAFAGEDAVLREDFMAQHYGHFRVRAPQRALYWKNYKYIATENDIHELYDLEADPFERQNIFNDEKYRQIKRKMQNRLLSSMDRYADRGGDVEDIRRVMTES